LARSRTGAWLRRLAHPRSWPVRWRLAAVSAGLTLAILVVFRGAIGQIATERIRDDFNNEVRSAVQILASAYEAIYPPFTRSGNAEAIKGPQLNEFVLPNDASAKIFDVNGGVLRESTNAVSLGQPQRGLTDFGDMRVATEVITANGEVTGFAQYGRSIDHIES